jgi:iron-sulfur cluster repair protein YtfE (RIC family)
MPRSIRRTYTKAQKISDILDTEEILSKASMTMLWAYLFERIHRAVTDKDYEALITLSQKLSTTTGNLHRIYLKLKETHTDTTSSPISTLTKEDLEEIEKNLKLL